MRHSESFSKQCLYHGAGAAAKRLDAPRVVRKHASDPDNKLDFLKATIGSRSHSFCVFEAPLSVIFEYTTEFSSN
jgi:hypothetical protein